MSESLQNGDLKTLEGLVEKDAISTLKTAVSQLSISQRQLISIDKDDIFYAFPYQVLLSLPLSTLVCIVLSYSHNTTKYHIIK